MEERKANRFRGVDVFVVRFTPFFMFIYMSIETIMAWNGILHAEINYILGNSMIFGLSMFLISLANDKYHCIWNRAMYIEMMLVPAINFIDEVFNIFPADDARPYLIFVTGTIIVTIIITTYLAIRHFTSF